MSGVIAGIGALVRQPAALVVVSGLEKIDGRGGDAVHQTVFLGDTTRPAPRQHVFQGFGFSGAFKGIPHDCVNEIENSQRDAAVVFDPKPEVLKKLGLKCGLPFRLSLHGASFSAKRLSFRV